METKNKVSVLDFLIEKEKKLQKEIDQSKDFFLIYGWTNQLIDVKTQILKLMSK